MTPKTTETASKPKCTDFIIAAVRMMRRKQKGLKQNTATATRLHKIFNVARELYSPEEIRSALDALVGSGEVMVIARIVEYKRGKRIDHPPNELIPSIPDNVPLSEASWALDTKGMPIKQGKEKTYRAFYAVRLYVKADGLPGKIVRCIEGKHEMARTGLAAQIVESMKKS